MDERIQHLKRLPLRRGEVWQGGLAPTPRWVKGEDGKPYRPVLALWVASQAGTVHVSDLVTPKDADPLVVIDAFFAFALESEYGGYRPGRIEVTDSALAEAMSAVLSESGIVVQLVHRLEEFEIVLRDFTEAMSSDASPLPGPLDGRDVTVKVMRSFAKAAADFYRAAPWQYLTNIDLIRVESPPAPPEMGFCTVLGAGGNFFGLSFYRTVDDLFAFFKPDHRRDPHRLEKLRVWQVSFNALQDLPISDAEIWQEHDLPVASRTAYPLFIRFGGKSAPMRANARQMEFASKILRTLAATTEAEFDSGRWSKTLESAGDVAVVTLALPDLLSPPSLEAWIKRGLEPDRRAHESMFAEVNRYFAEHPAASIDEANKILAEKFSGQIPGEPQTNSISALDRAQDLCFQAFDVFGRRRVQLAREALAISQDCADAHVILAEQAGTREAELEQYRLGVAAGKRALGTEFFSESVGHFWGIASTRPYMRALFGLAIALDRLGQTEEAIEHLLELLRLNPNDNQGARYLLLPQLLKACRDGDAARLLKSFDEDSANWTYSRALLAFRLSGKSASAARELKSAFVSNPYVPRFLTEESPLRPGHYSPGSPEEAVVAAEELRPAFQATEGAVDWALAELQKWLVDRKKKQRESRQRQLGRRPKGKRK